MKPKKWKKIHIPSNKIKIKLRQKEKSKTLFTRHRVCKNVRIKWRLLFRLPAEKKSWTCKKKEFLTYLTSEIPLPMLSWKYHSCWYLNNQPLSLWTPASWKVLCSNKHSVIISYFLKNDIRLSQNNTWRENWKERQGKTSS